MLLITSEEEFKKEVLESEDPVIVDFFAEWCGPCKMIAPLLETVGEETGTKIVKVDVDTSSDISSSYNVRGIPTIMRFENGSVVTTKVGSVTKAQLVEMVS